MLQPNSEGRRARRSHQPRRRAQCRRPCSPGRRREPGIGTPQVPPALGQQPQGQCCTQQLRFPEATDRDQLAVNRRPGPGHQRQSAAGRYPDDHRGSVLSVTIDPDDPRGLGSLNQHGRQRYGESSRHSEPATGTTHPPDATRHSNNLVRDRVTRPVSHRRAPVTAPIRRQRGRSRFRRPLRSARTPRTTARRPGGARCRRAAEQRWRRRPRRARRSRCRAVRLSRRTCHLAVHRRRGWSPP